MWNDRTTYRVELQDGRVGFGSAEFQGAGSAVVRYADLGVSRLIPLQRGADEAALLEGVREIGQELIGRV